MTEFDIIIFLGYIAGLLALGILYSSQIKNTKDMFAAGESSPWWIAGISGHMAMFTSGTFVVWGGIAFRQGLVGVSILMMIGISAWLVAFTIAARWKVSGAVTPAEYIENRFGRKAVHFYSWISTIFRMIDVGIALYAVSVILSALIVVPEGHFLAGSNSQTLSVYWAIVICGVSMVLVAAAGGLWAVLMADVIQFVVLTASVLIVIPLLLNEVGGIKSFIDNAPERFFIPYSREFPPLFLVGWVIIHFFKIGGQWAFVQRFLCVSSKQDAKKAALLFGLLFLVSPIFWMLPPMMYRIIDSNANSEKAFIMACQSVLPSGMLGLIAASMFAATASTVNSQINVFAGAFSREIYGKIARFRITEKSMLLFGRFVSLLLGLIVISIAVLIPSLGGAENVVLHLTGMLVTPIVLPSIWSLFSRKIGFSSVIATFSVSIAGMILLKPFIESKSGFIENPLLLEIWIIGIILPVSVLLLFEFTGSTESINSSRVIEIRDSADKVPSLAKAGRLRHFLISAYVLSTGLVILIIAVLNEQGRKVLLIAASALILAVIIINFRLLKNKFGD
ncbi:sodium:solute symporter family transporter [Sedimentisphaera salicampi]|uniref:sodium:solute symporter family transporter n=1 Tax=Sedimentisphaera salicampi TaxID=1941349 RepID=UPI000B9BDB02|nr:hypothetical protein [Sedimentisphaera salicampi]OXU15627.1 Na(+)/glucose symporter [Sedimentisphaera salicampi]